MERSGRAPATESVWDYPRPPRVEATDALVEVVLGGRRIVSTRSAVRVLETSHPPVFYVPVADVAPGVLRSSGGQGSWCEFKGGAGYFDLVVAAGSGDGGPAGDVVARRAAWGYAEPSPGYEALRGRVAVYPGRVEACIVDGEHVQPQAGDFYGGWITASITGPFKGPPGTSGW